MRKFKLFISIAFICCLSVSLFGCTSTNKSTYSYDEIYNAENISFDVGDDGIYTILKINDTHLYNGTCKNDKKTLEVLKQTLDNNSYDMIIVDGDLVDGFNNKLSYNKYKAADIFGELTESCNVPWIFVPGNNDGEKDGTTEELVAYLMQFDHLLYGNEKEITGAMQFFIDLTKNGETVHTIAILDSLSRDGDGNYDSIKENQIEWLLDGIDSRKVKTSIFFHMPTPAFKTAYEKRKNKSKLKALNDGYNIILASPSMIRNYIDKAISGNKLPTSAYGKVDHRITADSIQHSNGKIDIQDYYLEFVANDLRHAYEQHLNAKQSGDISLTKEDFEKIA